MSGGASGHIVAPGVPPGDVSPTVLLDALGTSIRAHGLAAYGIAAVLVPVAIAVGVSGELAENGSAASVGVTVLGWFANVAWFFAAALVDGAIAVRVVRDCGIGEALRTAFRRVLTLAGAAFFAGLAYGLASCFLIVPGVIAYLALCTVATQIAALDASFLQSLDRSVSITRGGLLALFATYAALTIAAVRLGTVCAVIGGVIAFAVTSNDPDASLGVAFVIQVLVPFLLFPMFSLIPPTYVRLRLPAESVDAEGISDVFA